MSKKSPEGSVNTKKKFQPLIRLLKNPMGLISILYLLFITFLAIFASSLAPFEANAIDPYNILSSPSAEHLLGTDSSGRDVLSQLMYGSAVTLYGSAIVLGASLVVGVIAGLYAGYYGGKFDSAANWVSNMFQSLPGIVILLAFRAAVGPATGPAMLMLGVLISPAFFRLTRTAVRGVRNELYVDAARVSGLSDFRIMLRHILTVVRAPIIIQAAMITGLAISIQSTLGFLGITDPSEITWGKMLGEGFAAIYINPLLPVWSALAISLTLASTALLGSALRDALEDSEKIKKQKSSKFGKSQHSKIASVQNQNAGHLLSVTNLSLGYPKPDGTLKVVVEDVSFELDRGEVLGIVGESGSGKTQTAFSILGLLPENAVINNGSIMFEQNELVSLEHGKILQSKVSNLRGKRLAYIPQEPMSNLDPSFKVGHQLVRPMTTVLGISKKEAKQKALALLEQVGIVNPSRVYDSYPHELSGGMAQRVLIAGAVSCDPDVLIADEPTTALDVTVQAEVLDLLRDLQKRLGMAMILVTHNFGVIADLADRVLVMQNGRVVETNDVKSILKKPKESYTQILLGSMLEDKEPLTMLTKNSGGK